MTVFELIYVLSQNQTVSRSLFGSVKGVQESLKLAMEQTTLIFYINKNCQLLPS